MRLEGGASGLHADAFVHLEVVLEDEAGVDLTSFHFAYDPEKIIRKMRKMHSRRPDIILFGAVHRLHYAFFITF